MKKKNLLKNIILVSLSISMLTFGNPKVANAQWTSGTTTKKTNPNTGLILAGIGATIAIVVIIIVVAKKKKKKNAYSYNFQKNLNNYQAEKFALPLQSKTETVTKIQMQKAFFQLKASPFFNSSSFMAFDDMNKPLEVKAVNVVLPPFGRINNGLAYYHYLSDEKSCFRSREYNDRYFYSNY